MLVPIFSEDFFELESLNVEILQSQIWDLSFHLELTGDLLFICILYLIFFSK